MWSGRVVIDSPSFDESLSISQTNEPVLIQTFVPELTVEAFDVSVLDRFSRVDEMKLHTVLVRPLIHGSTEEFRSIIYDDPGGQSTLLLEPLQHPHHSISRQRGVHLDGQCFPSVAIHQVQRSEFPSVHHAVVSKVHRPHLVRSMR